MAMLKKVAMLLIAGIALLYPFFVYWGMQRFEPKYIGLAVALIYLLRSIALSKSWRTRSLAFTALCLFGAGIWLSNSEYLLTLIPALISFGALVVFAHSYYEPPTIPAKFAQKIHGALSDVQIAYTNKVTLTWMLFFLLNGSIAIYTALYCTKEIWALYNGLISYILIGSLFACEFLYRTLVVQKRDQA